MRKELILIAAIILLAGCTVSKKMNTLEIEPAPPEGYPPTDVASYEQKYGNYDGVYLSYEKIMEHSGSKEKGLGDNWLFSEILKEKTLVLNPEDEDLTTITLYQKPKSMFVRVIAPDGSYREFGLEDLVETPGSGKSKLYKLVLPDVQKGTIIDKGFEFYNGVNQYNVYFFTQGKIWLQFGIPCEHLKFTLAYPEWWEIKTKKIGHTRGVPYLEQDFPESKKKVITYTGKDIPAYKAEPYAPFVRESALYLEYMFTNISMAGGYMKLHSNWVDYAEYYKDYVLTDKVGQYQYAQKHGDKASPLDSLAGLLFAGSETKLDRANRVLKFIYDSIEVDNSFEGKLDKVLRERKGDIYYVTSLALALFDKAGIVANFMLVHNAEDGYFDPNFINMRQLYIPAVRLSIDSTYYVACPYIDHLPLAHIPEYIQEQRALIITSDIKSSFFWELPRGNQTANTVDETYVLDIAENGVITVRETDVCRGSMAYDRREEISKLRDDEKDDYFKKMLTYTDADIDMNSYEVKDLEQYDLPLTVELEYTIRNLVNVTPEEIIFRTGGLFNPVSYQEVKIDTDFRVNPIRIYFDEQYNKNITINFPDNWQATTAFQDIAVKNKFGELTGTFTLEDNTIKVAQVAKLNRCDAPKDEISDLAELIGEGSSLYISSMIFKMKEEMPR